MRSPKYNLVYKYYNTFRNGERIWDIDKVRNAVIKGWITAEEFEMITGEPYEA